MQSKIYVGNNALKGFLNLVKSEFSLFKTLIIITENEKNKFGACLQELENATISSKVLVLPNFVPNNELTKKLLVNELEDDINFVICFGDSNLIACCREVIKITSAYILNSPSLISVINSSNYIVLDNNIIFNCSHKIFASCYGEVVSVLIYVLEEVFNKGIYKKEISTDKLIKLESYLNKLLCIPSALLKTSMGKTKFIKIIVEISKQINVNEFNISVLNTLKSNIIALNKFKGLCDGEALIIASKVFLNTLNLTFSAKYVNGLISFSPYARLQILKKFNRNLKTSMLCNNFTNFNVSKLNLQENFYLLKTGYLQVLKNYNNKFNTFLKIFCNLQYDKGFGLKKYINDKVLLNSFNRLPEQADKPNYATFLRCFGFLNKM